MSFRTPSMIETLALCFALSLQLNLIDSWLYSPLEHGSWVPFLIWVLPILLYRLGFVGASHEPSCATLMVIGVVSLLVGVAGSVNIIKNVGLAFVLAGFVPWTHAHWIWLASAVSWMRILGWLGSYYVEGNVFFVRLAIAIPASLVLFVALQKREAAHHEILEP